MSTDLQETINLMKAMASFMDPEEDYLTLCSFEDEANAAEARRRKELEEAHAKLKSLTKARDAARKGATRPPNVLSSEAHAQFLNEHEDMRLQLAKSINEVEDQQARAEAELAAFKEDLRELEECDPALEHERELTGTALRTRMYKGLGFEPILDQDGNPIKVIVRGQSGDVHTVEFNDGQSEFERVNRLWALASS